MSFADDKFLPSGVYAIINFEHNRSIAFNKQEECLSTSGDDYEWTISFLANKKWTIQGPSDVFIDIAPESEAGDDASPVKNPLKPHQWVIKRHAGEAQSYIIYSPSQPELFWRLPNDDERTAPQLDVDHTSRPSLWKFKKIEKSVADVSTPDPMKQFVAAPVQRPTQLASPIKNTFALTIPVGWLTTITSVSCGYSVNLVRVRRVVNGALEKQDLVSGWDAIDKAMTVDGSDSDSLALPTVGEAYVLVVEAFSSRNRARKDPRRLAGLEDLNTGLRVITTSRPNHMKGFPDYQTFTIFDESLDASTSERTQNAIITIHASVKVAVDLDDPGKPGPDTVNTGYNEDMDRPRPSHMDQWLEKYRVVFVVDDSSAMAINGAWGKAKDAVLRVVTEVMQYDTSGIDIHFLNSLVFQRAITASEEVVQVFGQIKPQGPSPIGARLEFLLGEIIDQLEQAKHNGADYRQVKPINIIVLTNSPPSDSPTKVIRSAARKLNEGLHHPNAVAIQFAQIGSDHDVEQALNKLSDDPSLNIADTVSFGDKFTPENLQKAVLGSMHPSVRAKVASSSGLQCLYYRIYDKESAITTKRPAYLNDAYLGCIRSKWVAPPHNAGSLRLCLSSIENIDPRETKLFATPSSKSALADDTPISLKSGPAPGITPDEPLVLFSESTPKDGVKPGTESLRVPPEAQSPLTSRFLYYGVYTDGGASTSKVPVDPQEAWVSRVDLDLIPPPLSVASLMRLISAKEGLTGSSQLFADKERMTPLSDNHILVEDGNWPGSTADDHVMVKFASRPGGGNAGGSIRNGQYFIENCATRGHWWIWVEAQQPLAPVSVYPPNESDSHPTAHRFTIEYNSQDGGYYISNSYPSAQRFLTGGPAFIASRQLSRIIPVSGNLLCFYISPDMTSNPPNVIADSNAAKTRAGYLNMTTGLDEETTKMWYIVPTQGSPGTGGGNTGSGGGLSGGDAEGSIRNGQYFIMNCATMSHWWIWVEAQQPLAPVSVYPPNESDSHPTAHRFTIEYNSQDGGYYISNSYPSAQRFLTGGPAFIASRQLSRIIPVLGNLLCFYISPDMTSNPPNVIADSNAANTKAGNLNMTTGLDEDTTKMWYIVPA
ncbi:hypothetical protein K438DRAFT_1972362 [Mycena galopus ATCC 62051]|nr:hypothetical protein K438DRAFT_1972362 [Mycena galopus ATCC 62051]